MEEKNEATEKLTYEQLEQIAIQLQNRAMQAEARLVQINTTAMRLDYLFKVLDRAPHFCESFVKDCSDEIVDLLEKKSSEEKKE